MHRFDGIDHFAGWIDDGHYPGWSWVSHGSGADQIAGYENAARIIGRISVVSDGIGTAGGPIASFNRWKELGRHVRRGEKAIELCVPVTGKRTVIEEEADSSAAETEITIKRFVYRRNWFMLYQTDDAAYEPPANPGIGPRSSPRDTEGSRNPVRDVEWHLPGYARGREIGMNPVAQMPARPRFMNWRISS